MFRNYLKIAFRNIVRHKAYSILNISGLAIGMACSILILLWVQNEMSYDRFHTNAGQLFRLTANAGDFKAAVSPAGMGAGLQAQMPEIRASVRITKPQTELFETGDRKFEESRVFYVDSNFFRVFSFALLRGDRTTALNRPDAVLITEDMAKKYFGTENPLGKILKKNNSENVTVAGVLANAPSNSHIQFDFISPISAIANSNDDIKNNTWGNFNFYTYLQLAKTLDASPETTKKLTDRIYQIFHKQVPNLQIAFQLQPLTDIHLHSNLQIDLAGNGNIQYVNIFFIVAIFVLGVACINFMNLATARSARRAKEVGLRKVVGAGRLQLIIQFLGESMVISFVSLVIAIGLVFLVLPAFNTLAGKELTIQLLDTKLLALLISIAFLTGLISGSYPALFLSGFRPVKVLKGKLKLGTGNLIFRNGLVIAQFVVSIMLLVGTAVVYKQLNYIRDKNLGFDKTNLLHIPMKGEIWNKQQALKAELLKNPLTKDYSIISDLPINVTTGTINVEWEGRDPKSQVVIPNIDIDENFIDVFQMKILAGRGFSKGYNTDSSNYIINETALHLMNYKMETVIGKPFRFGGQKGIIIGVVKDFNFKPLQYAVDPLILRFNRWGGGIVVVRTPQANTAASIKELQKIYQSLNPAYPFAYNFLDKDLDNLYRGEQRMGSIFNVFAILAIFISCLGLYGLSAFLAEQRTKEIGVRKVLGASVFNIVYLLSGNFTKPILIAMAIAIPTSWYSINSWLNGFAYHIDVNWVIFAVSSLAALSIAWITVSYESVKAAMSDPVKSLRTE